MHMPYPGRRRHLTLHKTLFKSGLAGYVEFLEKGWGCHREDCIEGDLAAIVRFRGSAANGVIDSGAMPVFLRETRRPSE